MTLEIGVRTTDFEFELPGRGGKAREFTISPSEAPTRSNEHLNQTETERVLTTQQKIAILLMVLGIAVAAYKAPLMTALVINVVHCTHSRVLVVQRPRRGVPAVLAEREEWQTERDERNEGHGPAGVEQLPADHRTV